MQIEFNYRGAIRELAKILETEKVKKALVFTGKKSFEGIKPLIDSQLSKVETLYYNDFEPNPKFEDIQKALSVIPTDFDIIIAVGGGSVIDFAKSYRHYSKGGVNKGANVKVNNGVKLIAIPTTCGTGSEATQFAVIYIDGKKQSIDFPEILPNYAIIDSQFVENNPVYLKACTAMDAFCQAIESYWAVKANSESQIYAKKAFELAYSNIVEYVNFNNPEVANSMMKASNLAGKAINISRTTAAHAYSYYLTSKYGIPHGHAVGAAMKYVFKKNGKINDLNFSVEDFIEIFDKTGLEDVISKLTIEEKSELAAAVNLDRLKNNPVLLEGNIFI